MKSTFNAAIRGHLKTLKYSIEEACKFSEEDS